MFPIYLVVVTPVASRFSGHGFIALNAEAKGLRGLTYGKDLVRAFVPIYRNVDPTEGEVSIIPYGAGQQTIRWAIVSAGDCGEQKYGETEKTIEVIAGPPEVVVQDRYTTEKPIKRIRSPNGAHEIRVFKERYEVYDLHTGAKVLDRAGVDPSFSPTGRFVASRGESGVIDLLSGKQIANVGPGDNFLAWVRGDSFAINGGVGWEDLTIVSTLTEDRKPLKVRTMCGMCRSLSDLKILVDVDNGYAAGISGEWRLLNLVTGEIYPADAARYETLIETNDEANRAEEDRLFDAGHSQWQDSQQLLGLIQRSFNSDLKRLPENAGSWNLGEPLKLSHVTSGRNSDQPELQRRSLVRHTDATEKQADAGMRPGALRGRRQTSRGIELDGSPVVPDLPSNLSPATVADLTFDRLKEVGLSTTPLSALEVMYKLSGSSRTSTLKKAHDIVADIGSKLSATGRKSLANGLIDCDQSVAPFDGPDLIWHWRDQSFDRWVIHASCRDGDTHQRNGALALVRAGTPDEVLDLSSAFETSNPIEGLQWELGDGARIFHLSDDLLAIEFGGNAFVISVKTGTRQGAAISLVDGNLLAQFRLAVGNRHLVQVNSDGRVFVYRLHDGQKVLSGVYVDGEIVLANDAGFYDNTFDGAQDVQVRFPGIAGLYYYNQFESILRRPGLVTSVLHDEQHVIPDAAPIQAPPLINLSIASVSANGKRAVSVTAQGEQELSSIRLYIDGRLLETRTVSGLRVSSAFEIADPGGGRWVSAVAVDRSGITSLPSAARLPGPPVARGTLRAVAVGVDFYSDRRLPGLTYAASDAQRIATMLNASKGRSVEGVVVTPITNEAVTPKSVLSAIESASASTEKDDTLVVSFSGHGVEGRSFGQPDVGLALTTSITNIDQLATTAVPWSSIARSLSKARGSVIVLLDACHAGATEGLGTNEDAAKELTASGAPIVVLAATKSRQQSFEGAGGGIFTTSLIQFVAKARAAGVLVDMSELYGAIKGEVVRTEKGKQTPWLVRNALIGDMSLF
ncbi:caspase domain-containing protein [Bradyrhizobium sp. 33ap4]|uniref:caspase family protein n=1 Tax=Bradyrhizobium sp. 33ap4 TaxID=3061630 RepID=UPI00292CEAF5|nr:caspase family protein [Bradyrhizobium sp. 33ap4]